MQDVMGADGAGLAAFVRNRYFYGKLLDVHHLEMEQRYLNEKRWLLNRLGLGTGVICGLELEPDESGRVLLRDGVAIDGRGREIVVTAPHVIEDPMALTDECGRPTGERANGMATISLCFHECDVDPAPVLVADCDVREECRPGAVRERFRVVVTDGPPDLLSRINCGALGGDEGGGRQPFDDQAEGMETAFDPSHHYAAQPYGDTARPVTAFDRQRLTVFAALCKLVDTRCAAPEHICVPIGVVREVGAEEGEDPTVAVLGCGARVPILSNVDLLDLMICLIQTFARASMSPVLHYEQGDTELVSPGTQIAVSALLTDPSGAAMSGELSLIHI